MDYNFYRANGALRRDILFIITQINIHKKKIQNKIKIK